MRATLPLLALLLAAAPRPAVAAEPAAPPARPGTASAAAEQAARTVQEAEDELAFLEFLGEMADGDQTFDDYLLTREFERVAATTSKPRPPAAKDVQR